MKEPPGTYAHKQTCALIGQTRQSGDDQMIKCWDQIQHSQPRGPMTMILLTECSCSRGCLTMSNPPPPNTHTHTQPRFQLPGMGGGGGGGGGMHTNDWCIIYISNKPGNSFPVAVARGCPCNLANPLEIRIHGSE